MGEISTISVMSDWLTRIESNRNELIAVAKSGNRVAASFAMAEARSALIDSLDDEQIKARLLRMTDPRIGMVELANNPSDEDRVRVCAIAILSGFCPGDDQFAVFGGKGGGKLYTKEAGFRTLFAHLGIVPEITTGHPEFVPLGTSGKKVWRVGGKASCDYQGKSYSVEFSGHGALGLPGYESDNVAGITAKARRQILKALWAKVSPILTQDNAEPDDDTDLIPPSVIAIEQENADKKTEADNFEELHDKTLEYLAADKAAESVFRDLWTMIDNAKTPKDFTTANVECKAAKAGLEKIDSRSVSNLRLWFDYCKSRSEG